MRLFIITFLFLGSLTYQFFADFNGRLTNIREHDIIYKKNLDGLYCVCVKKDYLRNPESFCSCFKNQKVRNEIYKELNEEMTIRFKDNIHEDRE